MMTWSSLWYCRLASCVRGWRESVFDDFLDGSPIFLYVPDKHQR